MSLRSITYLGLCSLMILSACAKTHKKSNIPVDIVNVLGASSDDDAAAKYAASRSYFGQATYSGTFESAAKSDGLDFSNFCMQAVNMKSATGIILGTALELSSGACPGNKLVPWDREKITVLTMKAGSSGYDIIGADVYGNSYTVGNAKISGGVYQVQDLCTNSYVSEGICALAVDGGDYIGLYFRD